MRAVLILIAIVLVLALVGWISFSKGPERSSINVEMERIRTDTNEAVRSGGELLHKAGDKLEEKAAPDSAKTPTAERETEPITR
jgi:hypothetical protein